MDEHWERLEPHIDAVGDCWEWTGTINPKGYGVIRIDYKQHRAHRLVYEALVGPVEQRLTLDHLCRYRRCVNPDHLEPVTKRVNTLRGYSRTALNRRKDTCPAGHPYDAVRSDGERACKTCTNVSSARWRDKQRIASRI